MKYFHTLKRKLLPNKDIDTFLSQLNILCKKHNMMLISQTHIPLFITKYDKNAYSILSQKIQNNLKIIDDDEENE